MPAYSSFINSVQVGPLLHLRHALFWRYLHPVRTTDRPVEASSVNIVVAEFVVLDIVSTARPALEYAK